MKDIGRFRGCLIGGAAGDALGLTVEFWQEERIFSRYGARGITEYALHDGKAEISDDTQMTLFTACGLLTGAARGENPMDAVRGAYLDWRKTQDREYPLPEGEERHTWLVNVPGLFDRRAPGTTCLSALHAGGKGTPEKPINGSKGCGGVMRVAPAGLYFLGRDAGGPREAARAGAEAAAMTHGHPLGWMPAAALAQIVYEAAGNGAGIPEAVRHALDTAREMWPETEEREYFISLTEKALELAGGNTDDLEAIHRLGEGWVAEETLAIAVYCAAKYEDDFDRALIAAVNHKGDSDSTGAVTGNILGAKLGLAGIPEKYIRNLELKDVILEIADDLYEGRGSDPAWKAKYTEMTYGK